MYDILKEISNLVFIYCIIVLWLIDINKRFSNKEKTFLSLFYTKNIIYKMESTTKSEINEAQKENSDDLEGIIQNEPHKNKYETVRYHKMNQFPYYLIGKVVSKFEIDGVNKFLNGVGILIGPSVVLTVAHNLTHMTQNGEILHTKKVVFFSSSNGDFNLFPPVKSVKTFTPEAYATALKKDEKETQLLNDWGLIFLATPVGNFITSLLDIDRKSELSVDKDNELYKFFSNNQTLKLDSLVSQTNSEKISIVGYTEFKEKYKNNSSYKFLKNFVKKDLTTSEKTDKNSDIKISLSIKKIVSDFVNEIGDDKKINININISEDVNEGLITSSHYYNPNKKKEEGSNVSLNGAEYIVFGEEGYNKEFDVTDAEKQIMSESKGKLVLSDEDREKIKYRLSTYKGQSGSPIFLRYKRISKSKKSDYVYQFVGLHSRRGLSVGTKNFFESEKMSALTENLLTGDVNQEYLGDVYKERIRAKIMNELSKNQLIGDDKNKICVEVNDSDLVKDKHQIDEIIAINGACDYNLAVNVLGRTVEDISGIVHEELTQLRDENGNLPYDDIKSDFVYTKILLNNHVKFTGLFKRHVPLNCLFIYGSKILGVSKEYVLLQDISNPYGLSVANYNFDYQKKLCEVMDDPVNCTSIAFELGLNIKNYGESIAEKILNKFLENYDLELNQLKQDFKKHMKALFHSIFIEISLFESIPLTYGKLFKKVRKIILKKLGMNEQAKH